MIGAIDRLTFGSAGRRFGRDEPRHRPLPQRRIPSCIVVPETTEIRSTLTAQDFRSSLLLRALLFSLAVHSALVAVPLYRAGHGPRAVAESGIPIEATLVAPRENAAGVAVMEVAQPLPSLAEFKLPPLAPPMVVAGNAPATPRQAGAGVKGGLLIEAQPLQDQGRLGDELATKLVTDFPVELDLPVRLKDRIVARYPPAALAAGREGSVAVWVMVDADGRPEEIQVTDGAEEFANSVQEALRAARFLPAQNNLRLDSLSDRPRVPVQALQGERRRSRESAAVGTRVSRDSRIRPAARRSAPPGPLRGSPRRQAPGDAAWSRPACAESG